MQSHPGLIKAVRYNCHVSDALHAGSYSICGLALRLRDLYKWENGLEPWIEKDSAQIIDWIDAREQKWETLKGAPFKKLPLMATVYDPFEVSPINASLVRENLFYGALYAQGLKPMFFLAEIENHRSVEGLPVFELGREFARDLATVPALSLEDSIIIRKSAARMHLWDQIVYVKKSGRPALEFALSLLGLKSCRLAMVRGVLPQLLAAQLDTYIYHEIGEMRQAVFDRDQWQQIIAAYPQTPVELLARASKDLLADTHSEGPLQRMIRTHNEIGLALYTAFSDGLLRELFPEIRSAFNEFVHSRRWGAVDRALELGRASGRRWAQMLMYFHAEGRRRDNPEWAQTQIENRLADYLSGAKRASEQIE